MADLGLRVGVVHISFVIPAMKPDTAGGKRKIFRRVQVGPRDIPKSETPHS